jgi:hypothetical protein
MELGENNDGGEMQDMIHQVDGDGSGEINVDESYRIMKKKHHPSSKPSAEPSSEHSSEHDCRDTIGAKCKCRAIFGAKCRAAFRAMCRAIFEPKLIPLVVLCPLDLPVQDSMVVQDSILSFEQFELSYRQPVPVGTNLTSESALTLLFLNCAPTRQ